MIWEELEKIHDCRSKMEEIWRNPKKSSNHIKCRPYTIRDLNSHIFHHISTPYKIRDLNSYIFHHISTPYKIRDLNPYIYMSTPYKIGTLLHAKEGKLDDAAEPSVVPPVSQGVSTVPLLFGMIWYDLGGTGRD